MALFNEVVFSPLLSKFGIHPADPTFGRYLLPDTGEEIKHVSSHSHISIRQRRVYISPSSETGVFVNVGNGEDVKLTEEELKDAKGKEWIFYKVWISETEAAKHGKAKGCDLVVSHGKSLRILHCCKMRMPNTAYSSNPVTLDVAIPPFRNVRL